MSQRFYILGTVVALLLLVLLIIYKDVTTVKLSIYSTPREVAYYAKGSNVPPTSCPLTDKKFCEKSVYTIGLKSDYPPASGMDNIFEAIATFYGSNPIYYDATDGQRYPIPDDASKYFQSCMARVIGSTPGEWRYFILYGPRFFDMLLPKAQQEFCMNQAVYLYSKSFNPPLPNSVLTQAQEILSGKDDNRNIFKINIRNIISKANGRSSAKPNQ